MASHTVDTSGFEPLEASAVQGHRWWGLEDLDATDEVVYPRALAVELRSLLSGELPAQPYEVT